ncbi:hypothetical protein ACJX0J_035781, partial [Zea mays]
THNLSTESQNKSTVTDPILMTAVPTILDRLAHTLPFVVFHVDVKGEKVRAILGGRFALFLQAHAAERTFIAMNTQKQPKLNVIFLFDEGSFLFLKISHDWIQS